MSKNPKEKEISTPLRIDISDEDIYSAMKDISGYLDITPEDFKEVYLHAYRHAIERIARSAKSIDIMTRKVYSVKRETPLKEVAEIMARNGISGVPVIKQDGSVVGVISEKDFLSRMGVGDTTFMGLVAECLKGDGCVAISIREQKAEDIMTSPAITVREDTTVLEIAGIFTEKQINRVPVIDQKDHLVGIVSRADIVGSSFIKTKTLD